MTRKDRDVRKGSDWGYECVEPELGQELWRLDDPRLEPSTASQLRDHLGICDACRLSRDLGPLLAESIAKTSTSSRAGADAPRLFAGAAGILLAASVACLMWLPPQPRSADLVNRAESEPVLLRPVEGEVVAAKGARLQWREVSGASEYHVTVSQVDGPFDWQTTTSRTRAQIPEDRSPSVGARLRVVLEPVPRDLAPPGGWSTSFRTAELPERWRYRLVAAPAWSRWLALSSLLSAVAALFVRRRGSTLR